MEKLKAARTKLFNARHTRIRPITDDKIILSWNALAIKALANAYVVFGDKRFLTDAIQTAKFIEKNHRATNGKLYRIYCKGKTSVPAFLDDYAYLAQAYIALYQATFAEEWLLKAKDLVKKSIEIFFDDNTDMFFLTSAEHDNIIVRKMEITDGVMPSSGAVMASNLISLSHYFRNERYDSIAKQMLHNIVEHLQKGGPYVYKWAHVYLKEVTKCAEIGLAGKNSTKDMVALTRTLSYLNVIPYIYAENSELPIASQPIDEGVYKLCLGNSCQHPTSSAQEVANAIKNERPFG